MTLVDQDLHNIYIYELPAETDDQAGGQGNTDFLFVS